MKLSQKCQYALRSVLALSRYRGQGTLSVRQLAEDHHMPLRFLELIFRDLRQAGLVRSTRGARGGYALAVHPAQLTVGEIVRLFDGDLSPVQCTRCGGGTPCPDSEICPLVHVWNRAREQVAEVYDSITFQHLLQMPAGIPVMQAALASDDWGPEG